MERRQETKAVKRALKAADINAKVGHGKGTAWGWLYIEIGEGTQWRRDCHKGGLGSGFCGHCPRCVNRKVMGHITLAIAQRVTGRSGEYDGNINIYTQDDDVNHPNWEDVTQDGTKNPYASTLPIG